VGLLGPFAGSAVVAEFGVVAVVTAGGSKEAILGVLPWDEGARKFKKKTMKNHI
jgi:hypothetical protein